MRNVLMTEFLHRRQLCRRSPTAPLQLRGQTHDENRRRDVVTSRVTNQPTDGATVRERIPICLRGSNDESGERMGSNDAKAIAAKNLIDGATVDELREAANDLRALSPESALAELVEAKIERMLVEQTDVGADDT